jgi:hypothetical protein
MKQLRRVGELVAAWSLSVATAPTLAEETGEPFLDLIRDGKPVATLIVPDDEAPIWDAAAAAIASTAERWGGAAARVVRLAKGAPRPTGDLIVVGTPESSDLIAGLSRQTDGAMARVPFIDAHGFAIEARTDGAAKLLFIGGKIPRGAYNGAIFCRDFLLDASAGPPGESRVFVRRGALVRSPRLAARGTYHLSLYGVAMTYTAEDWMKIIDRYAEDGMDRVYFWLSGHHPSPKYPRLYNVDATSNTRLTVDGVRRLIRYCHDRDIKFYIGGGVFAWTAAHYLIDGHPEIAAVKAGGLCPSQPFARTGNREHFLEMYDTWPEADGFMLEIRDEHGECQCARCQVALGAFGSKSYGRSEITWLHEFARAAWQRNPNLHLCWLIGYAEHARDVAYYQQIREMSDPRFEWLEVRIGLDLKARWSLPGPGGVPHPLAFFSRQISHFDPFYRMPINDVLTAARRCADEGLLGYVPAFEPGFGSGSYYGTEIPLPTNILPYCLTGFAYREATWEPGVSSDEFKARIFQRYFSPEAPKQLVDDMVFLHGFSIEYAELLGSYARPRYGFDGRKLDCLTVAGERRRIRSIADDKERQRETQRVQTAIQKLAAIPAALERMKAIETRCEALTPIASPKTRDGLALLHRLIDDTKTIYKEAVPDPKALVMPDP